MRVLSHGRLARRIAQALLVAFLWSMTFMGAGTLPASAQISTRATTAQSIAVVPFENLTVCEPETLGAKARALVSDELQTRLMLDVLSSKDVDDAMAELGLTAPLDEADLVRLATELEVGMVVTGKVTHAEVITEAGQCYAEVTLAVALFDRAAEATVNGAVVTARSPAGAANAPAEDLIDKALKQAVFLAVQEMKTRPTVTAMVLWAKGNEIFTNSGTRAGVTTGLYMVAIRGGQRIATVQITSSEATGSYGKIISGSPLQTGDHLRAMYRTEAAEPGLYLNRVITGAKRHNSRISQVAVAAGVLLGLAAYISSANNAVQGNFSTNVLRVSNLANGADLGESGIQAFVNPIAVIWQDPFDPEADPEFIEGGEIIEQNPSATILTWSPPSGSQSRRIAAYFGFRDEYPVGGAFPTHDENWILDTWAIPPGFPGAAVGHIALDVIPATGQIIVARVFDHWNPDIDVDSSTGELTYNPEYLDWVDSVVTTGVVNGITWGDTHIDLFWQVVGPYPNQIYQYKVLPLTIENATGSSAPNWRFVRNNFTFTTEQRITGVAAPPPRAPLPNPTDPLDYLRGQFIAVDSAGIAALLYKPLGADEMIVQVTRDQGDDVPVTFRNNVSQTVTSLNPAAEGPIGGFTNSPDLTQPEVSFSAAQLQSLPGTSDVYWLRVGARNRADGTQPLVWPLTSELDPGDPLHFDAGWVWWTQSPERIVLPTTGTGSLSAMKKDRDVLTNSRTGRGARIHRPSSGRELRVPR